MERTDWLDQGYDSTAARFLMLTAITHHLFDSPAWGQDEVRKLHLELTEIDMLTTQAAVEHAAGRGRRRLERPFLPVSGSCAQRGMTVDRGDSG